MELGREERQLYARQLSVREFGPAGQLALKQAKVLIVGMGGLGCPVLQYLAAAGVGTIGVLDSDVVEASNLQRQILFAYADVGRYKAEVAAARVAAANPYIDIQVHRVRLDTSNASELVAAYDLVVDATDNFATKFLINDACWFAGKPWVYGSIFQFEGQVSVFNAPDGSGARGPNYRDLLPAAPPAALAPNCSEAGVIGIVPGIIGCLQANEAIKLLTGMGTTLSGKLLTFDALDCSMSVLSLRKSALNPLSGGQPAITTLRADSSDAAAPVTVETMTIQAVLALADNVQLLDVRTAQERAALSLGGMHVPLDALSIDTLRLNERGVLLIYCESGVRSARAARLLAGQLPAGLSVRSLDGGVQAVVASGLDLRDIAEEFSHG